MSATETLTKMQITPKHRRVMQAAFVKGNFWCIGLDNPNTYTPVFYDAADTVAELVKGGYLHEREGHGGKVHRPVMAFEKSTGVMM